MDPIMILPHRVERKIHASSTWKFCCINVSLRTLFLISTIKIRQLLCMRDDFMGKLKSSSGLTLLEILILIGICGGIAMMLFPAILAARERSRREICTNHVKSFGAALHAYHDAHKQFPPSSGVMRDLEGKITAVDGWSWIAKILPYLDIGKKDSSGDANQSTFYKSLDLDKGRPLVEPTKADGTQHGDALATTFDTLLCPSSSNGPFVDPRTKKEAITNYKAMGATHKESLSAASPHPLTPKFCEEPLPVLRSNHDQNLCFHPDGNMFPGSSTRLDDLANSNGTAHTILVGESLEQRFARWTVGAESTVVGLPPNVEFEEITHNRIWYVPLGYEKALHKAPEADATYWTYSTYLDWDYDEKPYGGTDFCEGARYGPSSKHPGVVNHLFGDGSCQAIEKKVDVNLYMFFIRGRFRYF
jgi:type II secretory pathway pseudopilin PulG